MKRSIIAQKKITQLREQAEKIMESGNYTELTDRNESPLKLIHELQTVQIELEMQIDELHRSQGELTKSKADYTELYDHAPVGYMTTNAKGMILMANKTLADMLSIPKEELINKPVFNYIVPEDQDTYYLYLKNLSDVKQKNVCEIRMHKKDRTTFFVQIESTIISNESGKPESYRIVVIDITERVQTRSSLNKSREQYRMLFKNMIDGFALHEIICDDENHPIDYRFLDVNPSFEHLTGFKKDNLIGKTVLEVMPNTESYWIDKYGNVALTGEPTSFEKYSHELEQHYQVTAFRPAKNQFACIFTDVTDRKKYEKQIHQTQKMEAIGTLAGGIAHDFNNMLSVFTGNVSYALSILQKGDELFEVLSDALKGTNQARNLTQQLLTFAKGGEPIKKPGNINDLLEEAAKFVTSGAKSKCKFQLGNDTWTAEVDSGQFNQVISNLVINADQAMPNGGTIMIKSENTEMQTDNDFQLSAGPYIKISIEDQGLGIHKKHISNIFDPYFTTKQKGSGLGLSTTYSIVKKHGGHITIDSELGKGTVFNIYLPASAKRIKDVAIKEQSNHQGHGRILIMDDQEDILSMIERMLTQMGYEAEGVIDGDKAIALYREAYEAGKPFDLVILDLTVPGGRGGARTIPELLKIDPKVKAIVSSGYSNDPIMANYQDYGFYGVVPKPYTTTLLSEVLNNILDQNG